MILMCLAFGGCNTFNRGTPPPNNTPPPPRAVPVNQTTFTEADIDKDGMLSLEEAQTLPKEEPTTFLSAFLYIVCAVLAALIVSVVLTRRCKLANVDDDNKDESSEEEEETLLNETAMVIEPDKPASDAQSGTEPGGNVVK